MIRAPVHHRPPLRIAVFGESSSGKATFLNALIGKDILSVLVDPTTAGRSARSLPGSLALTTTLQLSESER